jgi:hypothetical protein
LRGNPLGGEAHSRNDGVAALTDVRVGLLIVVVLTHVAERLHLFPGMGWGQPDSIGHYLDLISAILGCVLLIVGSLGNAVTRQSK